MIDAKKLNPKNFPTTPEIDANLEKLAAVLNRIEDQYRKPLAFSSVLRNMEDHKRIYAEKNAKLKAAGKPELVIPMGSKHLYGQACDVVDTTGDFWKWCMEHLELMKELGVYFEDRSATPTWVHIQIVPPKSGRRVFLP